MDFELGAVADAFREEVRAFLAEHLTDDILERTETTGTYWDREFALALGERGWIVPTWPVEEGGAALDRAEAMVLRQELAASQAPMDAIGTTALVASSLRAMGTDEQRRDVVAPAVRGHVNIALGYSEANNGSDVAAARTRAVRGGDDWVINGEKMFTSQTQICDYVFLLARSNPDVPKHRGLTMFLVPTSSPGLEVFEIKTLGGERTNVTTYTDVRVPDSARVGEVDGGWAVLLHALELEHNAGFGLEVVRLLRVTAEEASTPDAAGRRPLDDATVRARLARMAIDGEVAELLALQVNWMYLAGQKPVAEGPMSKLFSSEAFARAASTALDVLGAEGLSRGHGLASGGPGVAEHAFRHSQVTRIYAGTSEIQRSIIAERGLGLPRSRTAG